MFTNQYLTVWLSETEKTNRLTKDDFCKGRKQKNTYRDFFSRFIPSIVGPELFRQRIQDNDENVSADTICTTSDEAFALLLIENSFDRWVDIFEKRNGIPTQRRGDRTKQCDSDIEPMYTHGGIKYTTATKTKTKGWTKQGIERYNELFVLVARDRIKHPSFLRKFRNKQRKVKQTPPKN